MEAKELDAKIISLRKKLDDTFVDEIKVSDPNRLKELIVKYSKEIEDIDQKRQADSTLSLLKSQVSDLNGGYRDAKKAVASKMQYVLLVLQERGIL